MSGHELAPVSRKGLRLADLAYQAVRHSIIDGSLAMGERLKETEIAAQLQISRSPVREAIQRLISEGLVVQEPHFGARVLELTAEDVADLYNVRLGLETTALRLLFVRGAETETLESLVSEMKSAAEAGDVEGVVTAELGWHRCIVESSRSELLKHMFRELEGRFSLAAFLEDRMVHSDSSDGALAAHLNYVVTEHELITEALQAGQHDKAIVLFEQHFLSTVAPLLKQLGGDPSMLLEPMSKSMQESPPGA